MNNLAEGEPRTARLKAAFVASIYGHFTGFHLPYMELLQKKGCEVHAYAQPGEGRKRLEDMGVVCHDIPICRSPLRVQNLRALSMLTDSFRKEQFRLVHVHTPVASFLGRMAAGRAEVPCTVYTAHGFHFFRGAPLMNWLLYYPLERWMARWTDVLITMNGEDWGRAYKFPVRQKVVYVPGVGIDLGVYGSRVELPPTARAQLRGKLGLPLQAQDQRAFLVLCIAELNANKNQKQLIEALGRLRDGQAGNVHLLLAGVGPSESALLELAERLGVRERVHVLGYRRDIPDLLAASDAAALVSYREGLPRAVMEAMAAGKPVIGTDIRGIRDLVADGVTGMLVPVGDAEATAHALHQLCSNRELASAMGEAGVQRIVDYGLPAVIGEMDAIYTEALLGSAWKAATPAGQPAMSHPGER